MMNEQINVEDFPPESDLHRYTHHLDRIAVWSKEDLLSSRFYQSLGVEDRQRFGLFRKQAMARHIAFLLNDEFLLEERASILADINNLSL